MRARPRGRLKGGKRKRDQQYSLVLERRIPSRPLHGRRFWYDRSSRSHRNRGDARLWRCGTYSPFNAFRTCSGSRLSRRLTDNYARHSDPNLRIEQKVLWAAFLTQVVRRLPPWESEIFTFMRPNELFGLTTEMWGTKLSSESQPGDIYGTQRQSFWICGIVKRPANTTPKTSAIQPRNPLIQQTQQTYHHMPHQAAQPSSSRLQGFSPSTHHPARPAPVASYPPIQEYHGTPTQPSLGPAPTSASYPVHAAFGLSKYVPPGSGPVPHGHGNGTTLPTPPQRTSISGYVAPRQPLNIDIPARSDPVGASPHVSSTKTHGPTQATSHRYMVSSSQPLMSSPHHSSSRPILPPPPAFSHHPYEQPPNLAPSIQSHQTSPAHLQNGHLPARDQPAGGSGASATMPETAPR